MERNTTETATATLCNGTLRIEINHHGAELTGLKRGGREYLWNGDPAYWKRHSPVLFPIVGSVWDGRYRHDGREYALSQHGFARDMDFTLIGSGSTSLVYELRSNEQTKEKYPFDFVLRIAYELVGESSVAVRWQVHNPSDSATMHFAIGAHPAFLLRPGQFGAIDKSVPVAAYFALKKQGEPLSSIRRRHFGEKGCLSDEEETLRLREGGLLAVCPDTFRRDAIVAEDSQIDEVTLLSSAHEPLLRLRFDAPLVGLWAPRESEYSPFVCIEPWYGRADRVAFDGDFAEKDWQNHLQAGQTFESVYYIDIM